METITSRKNPLLVHMKKLGSDRSYRYECAEFLCQGAKLFGEAKKHSAEITAVLFCAAEPEVPSNIRKARVPKDVLESISPMETVSDILFTCKMPKRESSITKGRHIILEDLQDPGNVGTILRTANAFLIDSVILTGTSADPYNLKTVRASMGAIFRQKIMQIPLSNLIEMLKKEEIALYATALDDDCIPITVLKDKNSLAVAIGNEGQGLSKELFSASQKRINIPMNPECESLNAAVAAAVVMWELYK